MAEMAKVRIPVKVTVEYEHHRCEGCQAVEHQLRVIQSKLDRLLAQTDSVPANVTVIAS